MEGHCQVTGYQTCSSGQTTHATLGQMTVKQTCRSQAAIRGKRFSRVKRHPSKSSAAANSDASSAYKSISIDKQTAYQLESKQ